MSNLLERTFRRGANGSDNPAASTDDASGVAPSGPPPPAIRFHVEGDNIGVLTFDQPGSSANVFNPDSLDDLSGHLDTIAAHPELKGLILISAKTSVFIAGADISVFGQASGDSMDDDIRAFVKRGQDLFQRIADLPFPTVAAIHGACLGGGCELALACDARIASPDKKTKIGLPEIMLGILPAWGGCHRLPKLIGLPAALGIILAGKSVVSKKAKKMGLVDSLVAKEHLLRIAHETIAKLNANPKATYKKFKRTKSNPITAPIIARIARKKAAAKLPPKNHYPAPHEALDVIIKGLGQATQTAHELEQDAAVKLVKSTTSQNLIRLFFLREAAKKKRLPGSKTVTPVKRVAVIGAGVMGADIAYWCASRGMQVVLKDIAIDRVATGMATAEKQVGKAMKRRIFSRTEGRDIMDRITPVASDVPLTNVDIIIEAATENLELKKKIFADLERRAGPNTLLATNTSALSIDDIGANLKDPSRLIGIHYFNPVPRMELVEIVRGSKTSDEATARAVKFVQASARLPVVVKDSPGFVVNRILLPYLIEAGHLFEGGVPIETIDKAMTDFGMPMGPIRLLDEIGVDTGAHVAWFFAKTFPERITVPAVLDSMNEKKWLGKKSKVGFYTYAGGGGKPEINSGALAFVRDDRFADMTADQVQERLIGLVVNEAARCLEEGVVESPGDIDLAMIMGTGFAPFYGGPLRMADRAGLANIVKTLENLAETEDKRFAPCEKLKTTERFYEG